MRASAPVRAAAIGLVPVLAACGGDARAAGPVVRDSAGVQIVENSAPAWKEGRGWRLSAEPALDIGMVDGPPQYQFGEVRGAARLGDGTVVVADNQSMELRFFDRAGRHVRTVGRKGGGPGEFQVMGSLFARDNTLAVADWSSRRVTVFAPDGRLLRSIPLDTPGSHGFTFPVGYLRGGALLLRSGTSFNAGSKEGLSRDSVTYLRLDPAGGPPRELGRFIGGQSWMHKQAGGAFMVTSPPFGRSSRVAAAPDGFFFGSSDAHEIARYDSAGRLLRLIRRREALRPVTPADVDRYKEVRLKEAAEARDASFRQMQERSLAAMRFPETFPAHGEIVLDRAGNLWASDFRVTAEDPGRWTVFDPEGRMLGAVATPGRFNVFDIGGDYVLGVWLDDMDVPHVRMYSLEKPGAGR